MTNGTICFYCGKIINEDKCPHCGYSFTPEFSCPRRLYEGCVCANTRKICRMRGDFEQCPILRGN
jgi:hypothetical protein